MKESAPKSFKGRVFYAQAIPGMHRARKASAGVRENQLQSDTRKLRKRSRILI